MQHIQKGLVLFLLWIGLSVGLSAQVEVSGRVVIDRSNEPIVNATVSILSSKLNTTTDSEGTFSFKSLSEGSYIFKLVHPEYMTEIRTVTIRADEESIDLGNITLKRDNTAAEDISGAENADAVTISQDELLNDEQGSGNISALLSASQDVFLNSVAYNFSAFRYDVRGMGSEYNTLLLNGVHVNDPESGNLYWSLWGGLNDMFRQRENDIGMDAAQYDFGHINGASQIDLRASTQRRQIRASYAIANRSYRNRVMLTYSTGLLDNGWAFSFSGSKRWAQEGYSPGSFYDAYAYFAGVEKKINSAHAIGLTVFGAPTRRGKSGPATQEVYDLVDDNYYNPYWGYQNGDKRNSRVGHTHEPVAILRYDYTPTYRTHVTVSAMAQKGSNGSTALNWFDKANDPRPDYYRKLPSYAQSEEVAQALTEAWQTDTDVSQIDWERLYEINQNSDVTLKNVNVDGQRQDISGKFARYLVEDRRYDGTQMAINGRLTQLVGDNYEFNGGVNYNYSLNHNYTIADDLLGADFYLNVDKFALRDSSQNTDFIQNDIDNPDRVVFEGDKFGHDYNGVVHRTQAWAQYQSSFKHVDFHVGASLTNTSFYREGLNRNGKFPASSFGKSEISNFLDYGLKVGLTYKLNGRNYFYANGMMMTQAPYLRNSFVSIRTRNQLVDNLESEQIIGGEVAYRYQAPRAKFKISGYAVRFKNQFEVRSFYLDEAGQIQTSGLVNSGFVNLVMKGIDKMHSGIEVAGEVELLPGLNLRGAAAFGNNVYTNRPELSAYLDNDQTPVYEDVTVYQKGFYVAGTPMTVANLGLSYNSPKYWFAHLNFNYFQDTYLDYFPLRRTQVGVQGAEEGSELWENIIHQESSPGGFTVDLFAGKSFKLKNDVYIYLNVGINNILDNKELITGGFEQYRYRVSTDFELEQPNPDEFPRKYFYSYGRNYFISLTFRK